MTLGDQPEPTGRAEALTNKRISPQPEGRPRHCCAATAAKTGSKSISAVASRIRTAHAEFVCCAGLHVSRPPAVAARICSGWPARPIDGGFGQQAPAAARAASPRGLRNEEAITPVALPPGRAEAGHEAAPELDRSPAREHDRNCRRRCLSRAAPCNAAARRRDRGDAATRRAPGCERRQPVVVAHRRSGTRACTFLSDDVARFAARPRRNAGTA